MAQTLEIEDDKTSKDMKSEYQERKHFQFDIRVGRELQDPLEGPSLSL